MIRGLNTVIVGLAAVLLSSTFISSATAAGTSPRTEATGSAQPTHVDATQTLGTDDVIEVTVQNHSDLNRTLTISPEGKITFPEIGEIDAAGKTPRELAVQIQMLVERTRNNAVVTVSVKEVHSRRVRALGAVHGPGAFDLKRNWRVVDLVAAAGGLGAKPSKVAARIIRNSTKVIPLDLTQALASPDGPANVALEPDDLVLFDEIEIVRGQVFVLGQVGKPGLYESDPDTTVMALLSLAGNPTDRAALSKAYLLRGDVHIPVNLRTVLIDGKPDDAVTKLKVQAGDVLYLPENEERYAVMGQVSKPGYYTLPEKGEVTLVEALNMAGGQAQTGDLTKAGIVRTVDGKPIVLPVNLDKMLKKGDLTANVALRSGDVLYIPEKNTRHGFGWQDLLSPLTALSFLGFRIGR